MTPYLIARAAYRWADQAVLSRLPATYGARLNTTMYGLARRLFPKNIKARSVGEFSRASSAQRAAQARLPTWVRAEVAALAQLDVAILPLLADDAVVEAYFIPWDLNYVGSRYKQARRDLKSGCARLALVGAGLLLFDPSELVSVHGPLTIIDVDANADVARMAGTAGATYLALPAEQLNVNDHCAVLARLVLQLAPAQVLYVQHPVLDRCVELHGLAMASVTDLQRWETGAAIANCYRVEGA